MFEQDLVEVLLVDHMSVLALMEVYLVVHMFVLVLVEV